MHNNSKPINNRIGVHPV